MCAPPAGTAPALHQWGDPTQAPAAPYLHLHPASALSQPKSETKQDSSSKKI